MLAQPTLKGFHERVLRHFARVVGISAELSGESVDAMFIAMNELLKCSRRAGLGLPGQLCVRFR